MCLCTFIASATSHFMGDCKVCGHMYSAKCGSSIATSMPHLTRSHSVYSVVYCICMRIFHGPYDSNNIVIPSLLFMHMLEAGGDVDCR